MTCLVALCSSLCAPRTVMMNMFLKWMDGEENDLQRWRDLGIQTRKRSKYDIKRERKYKSAASDAEKEVK